MGNSADPANEHIEALAQLEKFKESNIKIYVPLSYGNQAYAEQVIEYGKTILSNHIMMSPDKKYSKRTIFAASRIIQTIWNHTGFYFFFKFENIFFK